MGEARTRAMSLRRERVRGRRASYGSLTFVIAAGRAKALRKSNIYSCTWIFSDNVPIPIFPNLPKKFLTCHGLIHRLIFINFNIQSSTYCSRDFYMVIHR